MQETPTPIDLRLVALTPDRSHLVLEDAGSRQYHVPVDARFAAALKPVTASAPGRNSTRPGQLEIALESQLSPREIQTRIRAGHSVDEVAAVAGISTDRVERYALPVIAEREHVVEQAQRAPARRATGGKAPSLSELVHARLAEQRVPADTAEWDAFRGDEDRWTIRLGYLAGGRSRSASWTFDPRGRVLAPADDEARWMVDDDAERVADEAPAAVRRLTSVPGGAGADDGSGGVAAGAAADEVYDRERDEPRTPSEGNGGQQPAAATAGRSHRRPAVPSWDDIMFGTRRRD